MKFMPLFLPIFSFTLPAAIVIYFLVSNVYRIGQQYYITRSMYHGEDSLGAQVRRTREEAAKNTKKGGKSGGAKGGSAKGGSAKGGGAKKSSSKGGAKASSKGRSNGARGGGGKKKTATATRSSAPGRNTTGRSGSARAQVQPRARKKRKR